MTVRIAIVADTHFDLKGGDHPRRRCEIADELLERAVEEIDRGPAPDLVLHLGDVVNDETAPESGELLARMGGILSRLSAPTFAIRGNHDPEAETFASALGETPQTLDVGGARFVFFDDPEEPGFHASRTTRDLERMAEARDGFDGPLVTVQHVPLFPPGTADCPYGFANAHEVVEAMARHGYVLSLSGHYHAGAGPVRTDDATFVIAPALCEAPFPYLEVEIDEDGEVAVERRELDRP